DSTLMVVSQMSMASNSRGKSKRSGKLDEGPASKRKRRRYSGSEDEDAGKAASSTPSNSTPSWTPKHFTDFRNSRGSEPPAELFRKDLISAMKLPDNEPLAPGEYWHVVDQWKQEWERGVQVPVNRETLPLPHVRRNPPPYGIREGDFRLPKLRYIRITMDDFFSSELHQLSTAPALAEKACKYDLDDVDIQWLKRYNAERAMMGLSPVGESSMERAVEEFEQQCWRQIQTILKEEECLGIEYDENVICDVCRSPDHEDGNLMVFCDCCNVCVHQACYGITTIPRGPWLCRTCALGIQPSCVLCPNKGGAMKPTKSGQKWAHVCCALWIPEVSIGVVEKMEPITNISEIPGSRWSLVCCLCKQREGACIQCSVKTCKTAYHVTCGFQHGLELRCIIEDDTGENVRLKSYCQKHSKKPEPKPTDEPQKKKKKEMTSLEKDQARTLKLQQMEAEFYKHVNLKEASKSLSMNEEVIEFIFNYWKLKRKSVFNKPLLPPRPDEVELLPQQQDQDRERLRMFLHLRQDLERVRNLCYMVTRREKMNRSYLRLREQTLHQQITLLRIKGVEFSPSDMDAILHANHGPSIYDDRYSDPSMPRPTMEEFQNQISRIKGLLPQEKDLNGLIHQKGPSEPNPYRRKYFNGAERRRYGMSSRSASSASDTDSSIRSVLRSSASRGNANKAQSKNAYGASPTLVAESSSDEEEELRKMTAAREGRGRDIYTDSDSSSASDLNRSRLKEFNSPSISLPPVTGVPTIKTKAAMKQFSGSVPPEKWKSEETGGDLTKKSKNRDLDDSAKKNQSKENRKPAVKGELRPSQPIVDTSSDEEEHPLISRKKSSPAESKKPVDKSVKKSQSKEKILIEKPQRKPSGDASHSKHSEKPSKPGSRERKGEKAGILSYVPQRQAARKAAEHITDISKSKDIIEELLEDTTHAMKKGKSPRNFSLDDDISSDELSALIERNKASSRRDREKKIAQKKKRSDKHSIFMGSDDSDFDLSPIRKDLGAKPPMKTQKEKDEEFNRLLGFVPKSEPDKENEKEKEDMKEKDATKTSLSRVPGKKLKTSERRPERDSGPPPAKKQQDLHSKTPVSRAGIGIGTSPAASRQKKESGEREGKIQSSSKSLLSPPLLSPEKKPLIGEKGKRVVTPRASPKPVKSPSSSRSQHSSSASSSSDSESSSSSDESSSSSSSSSGSSSDEDSDQSDKSKSTLAKTKPAIANKTDQLPEKKHQSQEPVELDLGNDKTEKACSSSSPAISVHPQETISKEVSVPTMLPKPRQLSGIHHTESSSTPIKLEENSPSPKQLDHETECQTEESFLPGKLPVQQKEHSISDGSCQETLNLVNKLRQQYAKVTAGKALDEVESLEKSTVADLEIGLPLVSHGPTSLHSLISDTGTDIPETQLKQPPCPAVEDVQGDPSLLIQTPNIQTPPKMLQPGLSMPQFQDLLQEILPPANLSSSTQPAASSAFPQVQKEPPAVASATPLPCEPIVTSHAESHSLPAVTKTPRLGIRPMVIQTARATSQASERIVKAVKELVSERPNTMPCEAVKSPPRGQSPLCPEVATSNKGGESPGESKWKPLGPASDEPVIPTKPVFSTIRGQKDKENDIWAGPPETPRDKVPPSPSTMISKATDLAKLEPKEKVEEPLRQLRGKKMDVTPPSPPPSPPPPSTPRRRSRRTAARATTPPPPPSIPEPSSPVSLSNTESMDSDRAPQSVSVSSEGHPAGKESEPPDTTVTPIATSAPSTSSPDESLRPHPSIPVSSSFPHFPISEADILSGYHHLSSTKHQMGLPDLSLSSPPPPSFITSQAQIPFPGFNYLPHALPIQPPLPGFHPFSSQYSTSPHRLYTNLFDSGKDLVDLAPSTDNQAADASVVPPPVTEGQLPTSKALSPRLNSSAGGTGGVQPNEASNASVSSEPPPSSTAPSDTSQAEISIPLEDSRHQLKVKIKGPFLDANYSSTPAPAPPSAPSEPSTVSTLRRMRKKELIRQYCNQDMNVDAPSGMPAIPQTVITPITPRTVITIPKAVTSMTTIPTREDYRAFRAGGANEQETKGRRGRRGVPRELRNLGWKVKDQDKMEGRLRDRVSGAGQIKKEIVPIGKPSKTKTEEKAVKPPPKLRINLARLEEFQNADESAKDAGGILAKAPEDMVAKRGRGRPPKKRIAEQPPPVSVVEPPPVTDVVRQEGSKFTGTISDLPGKEESVAVGKDSEQDGGSTVKPTLEDLKRQSMEFRAKIMATFKTDPGGVGDSVPLKSLPSQRRRRKKVLGGVGGKGSNNESTSDGGSVKSSRSSSPECGVSPQQVKVLTSESTNAPKIIIRFGKRAESVKDEIKFCDKPETNESKVLQQHHHPRPEQETSSSSSRKDRDSSLVKVMPIKLKLSRRPEGYVTQMPEPPDTCITMQVNQPVQESCEVR
ncbi:unnamed protein product, partial [Darwinula stevensoni]